jgi:hypothetical protein
LDLLLLTVIGGIAWRGANTLLYYENTPDAALYFPRWANRPTGRSIIRVFALSAIPIALINGYVMYQWGGLVLCGVGTWLFMLLSNLILRFSPANQLYFFGSTNLIWTFCNIVRVL